ncbi:MAG: cytochrome C biogenesis protein, partial [Campylobacterales bacterium]|nr:cytochrome C biogenesis protein [Campylobacterales bacterium]
ILTSKALSFFNKIKQHFKIIEIVAGVLLVLIGIAVATGGLGQITTLITDLFS